MANPAAAKPEAPWRTAPAVGGVVGAVALPELACSWDPGDVVLVAETWPAQCQWSPWASQP